MGDKTDGELRHLRFRGADGEHSISVPIFPPADQRAFFLFGLRRSGSTLLNRIFSRVCRLMGIPMVSLPEAMFQAGYDDDLLAGALNLDEFVTDGYCFRGFRSFPAPLSKCRLLAERPKILLVRDPRDALVSHYFAFGKGSHKLPESGPLRRQMLEFRELNASRTIDDYALDLAGDYREKLAAYRSALEKFDNLRIDRYEDVIFNKLNWAREMLEFVGLRIEDAAIEQIITSLDVVPPAEDAAAYIRKVTPGDHREKLRAETILKLNQILDVELTAFGYEQ